jgi:hypothetical protein|tara:strand:- start:157 stop:414 length:258 start_codon:yes stop_codon:yes gene_type:complete
MKIDRYWDYTDRILDRLFELPRKEQRVFLIKLLDEVKDGLMNQAMSAALEVNINADMRQQLEDAFEELPKEMRQRNPKERTSWER